MALTSTAIALHEQLLIAEDAVAPTLVRRPRSASSASSALSSLASSDSEDGIAPPPTKRRKNESTPPTSIDEPRPNNKRAPGKRGARAVQSEYDVKDRKTYLDAGLYASTRGSTQPGRQARAKQAKNTRLLKTVAEIAASFRMDLPLHHGLAVIEQRRDFRLPYDILNDFDLSKLPDTVEGTAFRSDALDRIGQYENPTTYRPIKTNKLLWRQKDEAEREAVCLCTTGFCDENCLNRIMQFFCSTRLCKFKDKCTNLPFSTRKLRHNLEVFWTGNRGFGLRTNGPIAAGDFIIPYVGEIISFNESYRRVENEYKHRHDYYFLHYFDAEVVDAGMVGNEARFINHSCDPNIHVVRWKLADYDEYEIGLFALRDIDAKEELSYDYGWQQFSSSIDFKEAKKDMTEASKQRCLCAGESCTGFLEKSEKPKRTKSKVLSRTRAGDAKGKK